MQQINQWKYISAFAIAILMVTPIGLFSQTSSATYNKATETTVKGTVSSLSHVVGGEWAGTHLAIKTDHGFLDVYVGPTWFLEKNKVSFASGDQVEATGSKATFIGSDAILARQIKKGGQDVTLRDEKGGPLWAGIRW